MKTGSPPRIFAALVGDVRREPGARVKYGFLLEALQKRFQLAAVFDATLRGAPRLLNALRVFHFDRRRWKERFYQNVPAFKARSRKAARALRREKDRVNVVFQISTLFNACCEDAKTPALIYTDYTARLSAKKPDGGRAPYDGAQHQAWVDLERQTFERAAHIFTRARFVRDNIVSEYGIDPRRVSVVGGGVNLPALPELNSGRLFSPTVLFIGKDFYRKGGDILLRAFAAARERVPEAALLLVTADPVPESAPLAGVEVIPATWDRERIQSFYHRASIFVLPSRLETWGDVLLEAMSYGLACIGVQGDAMEEIIDDGETGLIVPAQDEAALASALIRLLAEPSLCRTLGSAARRQVETRFTWDRVVEKMEPIIWDIVLDSN
jgi:glycosyltransferase involved in cell wall biosynthesis